MWSEQNSRPVFFLRFMRVVVKLVGLKFNLSLSLVNERTNAYDYVFSHAYSHSHPRACLMSVCLPVCHCQSALSVSQSLANKAERGSVSSDMRAICSITTESSLVKYPESHSMPICCSSNVDHIHMLNY